MAKKVTSLIAAIFFIFPTYRELQYLINMFRQGDTPDAMAYVYFLSAFVIVVCLAARANIGAFVGIAAFSLANLIWDVQMFIAYKQFMPKFFRVIDFLGYASFIFLSLILITNIAPKWKKGARYLFALPFVLIFAYQIYYNIYPCLRDLISLGVFYWTVFSQYVLFPVIFCVGILITMLWEFYETSEKDDQAEVKIEGSTIGIDNMEEFLTPEAESALSEFQEDPNDVLEEPKQEKE